jgi:hypothetical protein
MAAPAFGGLMAGAQAAPAAPTNKMAWDYSGYGNAEQQFIKAMQQQQLVRNQLFEPQFDRALEFVMNQKAPEQAGRQAMQQASRYNRLSREQFMRMNERSQAAVDPRGASEQQRLSKFDDAKNIANAYYTAKDSTKNLQLEQLAGLVDYGTGSARQALGLSGNAASAYQTRMNQNSQAEMAQKNAQAQAQTATMNTAISVATSVAIAAAIA